MRGDGGYEEDAAVCGWVRGGGGGGGRVVGVDAIDTVCGRFGAGSGMISVEFADHGVGAGLRDDKGADELLRISYRLLGIRGGFTLTPKVESRVLSDVVRNGSSLTTPAALMLCCC